MILRLPIKTARMFFANAFFGRDDAESCADGYFACAMWRTKAARAIAHVRMVEALPRITIPGAASELGCSRIHICGLFSISLADAILIIPFSCPAEPGSEPWQSPNKFSKHSLALTKTERNAARSRITSEGC